MDGGVDGDVDDTPLAPGELGPRLAEVFAVLGPLYRRVARQVEADEAIEGVPIGVRAVLERLQAVGEETVPSSARALALSRQFVQRSVNEAVERGWLGTRANPAHRRSSLVGLTPSGAAAIATVTAREQAVLGGVGGGLTARDVDTCLRVLRAMHEPVADVEP